MTAYYNENDAFAAAWLRELIKGGHIAPGYVDERSIEDVHPDDLAGYIQCHFFAGIGVWSHALRLAGWPDDRPIWTGSCPCQPFSAAGKRTGVADERHLWPAFNHLIEVRRPAIVFGEQVASPDGLAWLDLVQADMEAKDYAFAAGDICAAGVGAPHIRQRLYWVADADAGTRAQGRSLLRGRDHRGDAVEGTGPCGGRESGRLADTDTPGRGLIGGGGLLDGERPAHGNDADGRGEVRGLADASGQRLEGRPIEPARQERAALERSGVLGGACPANGFWRNPDWLLCRDAKWRPVESGTFPLVDGTPGRVGRLRGYGNALVAQQAAAFIKAYLS